MGWLRRFIGVITCRGCKTTDERGLRGRNKLRLKLGKNKIVPLASTDLDIRVEREETIIRTNANTRGVDDSGDQLTSEDRWAAPRTPSNGSIGGIATDDSGEQLTPEGVWAAPKTSGKESVRSDLSLVEFASNYVKTEVLAGAIARLLAEQQGNNVLDTEDLNK